MDFAVFNDNPDVTHCFKVHETDEDQISRILITISKHAPDDISRLSVIVQGLLIEQIEQERDRIAEQQITIHQLKKEPNLGFYFTATDKTWN